MLMDILGIVIGFCSIMLIFSLLVTALVHGTQASLNMRVRNMRNVIAAFMDQFSEIDTKSVLDKIDRRIPNNINPLIVPHGGKLFSRQIKLSSISKKELMCITEDLLGDASAVRNKVNKEIERSFDYLEEVMAQRFKQWMHQLSILTAFVITFVFQLNTFELISELNRDTALRNQAMAYGASIQNTGLSEGKSNEDRQQSITNIQEQMISLRFEMFEHGWPYYFGSLAKQEPYPISTESTHEMKSLNDSTPSLGEVLQNWFGVICSAIFISLGAPFWFNSLKNVLDLRDKLAAVSPAQAPNNIHTIQTPEKRSEHG